jgi:hypothetical protein
MVEQMGKIARPRWALVVAILAGLFGLLTLKSGGEVLFIDGAGRRAAGNYVTFVVWFNFVAGFAYIAGAVGLALWRSWVVPVSFAITALTLMVFAAFGIHILMDGAYETRTVGAMSLRSFIWFIIFLTVRGKV